MVPRESLLPPATDPSLIAILKFSGSGFPIHGTLTAASAFQFFPERNIYRDPPSVVPHAAPANHAHPIASKAVITGEPRRELPTGITRIYAGCWGRGGRCPSRRPEKHERGSRDCLNSVWRPAESNPPSESTRSCGLALLS